MPKFVRIEHSVEATLPVQVFIWQKNKQATSDLPFLAFQGLIFFNFRQGFFRKSSFCTFSSIYPGFGGPQEILCIFFLFFIFIMLQKNAFGKKEFRISCMGSKVPFWQFFNFSKMALLNPCAFFRDHQHILSQSRNLKKIQVRTGKKISSW